MSHGHRREVVMIFIKEFFNKSSWSGPGHRHLQVAANLMTSCSVQTKRTYRQHMEMSLFIYQFLSIQSSIMNSSSVVCKQCLLNISTIYLASRPISKYPYPNIWTRAEHLYSNVSLLLDQSNGNISFCRDLWKNISLILQ